MSSTVWWEGAEKTRVLIAPGSLFNYTFCSETDLQIRCCNGVWMSMKNVGQCLYINDWRS